jgi:hypothetical protein
MTDLILYSRLQTKSRRALLKVRGRFGRPYFYRPRGDLLQRLSRETGLSIEQVYVQLFREREILLRDILPPGL